MHDLDVVRRRSTGLTWRSTGKNATSDLAVLVARWAVNDWAGTTAVVEQLAAELAGLLSDLDLRCSPTSRLSTVAAAKTIGVLIWPDTTHDQPDLVVRPHARRYLELADVWAAHGHRDNAVVFAATGLMLDLTSDTVLHDVAEGRCGDQVRSAIGAAGGDPGSRRYPAAARMVADTVLLAHQRPGMVTT